MAILPKKFTEEIPVLRPVVIRPSMLGCFDAVRSVESANSTDGPHDATRVGLVLTARFNMGGQIDSD